MTAMKVAVSTTTMRPALLTPARVGLSSSVKVVILSALIRTMYLITKLFDACLTSYNVPCVSFPNYRCAGCHCGLGLQWKRCRHRERMAARNKLELVWILKSSRI
jgi:hypothetical protein